ncbi:hypothetical protein NDU88_008611 [Pleurodeles waltl]|uniref:Uncharacterized protein n=1 Tax=Pleurodeles waltl TaxID=8319 RepID=A0AAV7NYG8_PLEWA|nr:hypothetical protein NDU88_008611 [Pleurodeles waltl]
MASRLLAWTSAGVTTVGDCCEVNTLLAREEMQEQFDLPRGQFLNYEPVLCTYAELWGRSGDEPPNNLVLQLMLSVGSAG